MDSVQIAFGVISLGFLCVEQRVMCIVTWMMLLTFTEFYFICVTGVIDEIRCNTPGQGSGHIY